MDFDLPFNVEKQNQARRLKHMELELMEEEEKNDGNSSLDSDEFD